MNLKDKLFIAVMILAIVVAFFAGTMVGPLRAQAKGTPREAEAVKMVNRMFEEMAPDAGNRAKAMLVVAAVLAGKQ